MKTILPLALMLVVLGKFASAQDISNYADRNGPVTSANSSQGRDLTGFTTKTAPSINPESSKMAPNPHPDLRPRTGGVVSDGIKYGTVMISPTAPASYGMGEKNLTAPDTHWDLQHESGPAAHRDAGGFKLFSVEF